MWSEHRAWSQGRTPPMPWFVRLDAKWIARPARNGGASSVAILGTALQPLGYLMEPTSCLDPLPGVIK